MPATINDAKVVLVTGATAGIGRSLATAIKGLPSKPTVIAAGRRQERLDELKAQGFETSKVDMDTDHESIQRYVEELVKTYPDLDTIVLNAGTQYAFHFSETVDPKLIRSEFNVNYLSIVSTITAITPHFQKLAAQGRPTFIVTVTSSLAVVPSSFIPNYCASKAAMHSMTLSLQNQFRGTNIHVQEVMPPLVESELHDEMGISDKLSSWWMPLKDFTAIVLDGLTKGDEIITAGMATDDYEKFGKAAFEQNKATGYERHQWD